MRAYVDVIQRSVAESRARWCAISLGFVTLYYVGIMLLTMLRFGEVPNYVVFHDVFGNYVLIFDGTPALSDALPILIDEPWFETGFKDPEYYGVASWSYMLMPLKMLLVFFTGMLVATVAAMATHAKTVTCALAPSRQYALAGAGSALVGLANITLTWVVCCATPSWVVALAMLGLSVSLAEWLDPFGPLLTISGLLMLVVIIARQARHLARAGRSEAPATNRDHKTPLTHAHA